MDVARDWKDYEILDMANGEKLEKWKDVILVRPDPQIIWKSKSFPERWKMQMLDTLGAQQEAEIGILTKRFLLIGK